MHRLLFALTLALYGFSALELHEWVRVPQVVVHLLEHHSDLGHHDAPGEHDENDPDHDHTPFDVGCHGEFCACNGVVAVAQSDRPVLLSQAPLTAVVGASPHAIASGAFTGNVWNPPKLG